MPKSEWRSIHSSHVDSVRYDDTTNEYHVRWQRGNTTIYSNVTPAEAAHISNSWSVGAAIKAELKDGKKPFRPGE